MIVIPPGDEWMHPVFNSHMTRHADFQQGVFIAVKIQRFENITFVSRIAKNAMTCNPILPWWRKSRNPHSVTDITLGAFVLKLIPLPEVCGSAMVLESVTFSVSPLVSVYSCTVVQNRLHRPERREQNDHSKSQKWLHQCLFQTCFRGEFPPMKLQTPPPRKFF